MKTQRLLKLVSIPLLITLATGCTGNVFGSKGTSSSAGKNDGAVAGQAPNPKAQEGFTVSATSSEDMLKNLLNENFSVVYATYVTGPKRYFTLDVDVPFARVLKPLSQLARQYAPQVCKLANLPYAGEVYHNAELPCGYPDNDNTWKSIFTVNIPGLNGWSGSIYYDIYGFQVPLKIGRSNQTGPYTEDSLDTLGSTTFQSSQTLGEDISVMFRPHGNVADLEVCMNIPGQTITTPPLYLYGNAYKSVLGVSVTLSANSVVRPGIASFQYIRQCFAATGGFDTNTGSPVYQITHISNPDIVGTQLQYTQLQFQDWITNLLSNILNFFGTNVSQQIANYLQTEVKTASEDDVKNGQFLIDAARGFIGDDWAQDIGAALNNRLHSDLVPSSGVNLKNALSAQCDRLSSLLSEHDVARLDPEKCRSFLDMVDLYLVPFKYDADQDAKGCYSHFANIHKSNTGSDSDYWWKTECRFKIKMMVGIPKSDFDNGISQIQQAVIKLASTLRDDIKISSAFATAGVSTSGLNLDGPALDRILAQMKSEGYKNIAREDLTEYIRKNADLVRSLAKQI